MLATYHLLLTLYYVLLPGDDIASIGEALPPSVQTMLVSATITPDLDKVTYSMLWYRANLVTW